MTSDPITYKFSNWAVVCTLAGAIFISAFFKWGYDGTSLNFVQGDARDYYSYLISVFINHNLDAQSGNDWFLIKTSSGVVNVHPVGVSLLLLPFFLTAFVFASASGAPVDGMSLPFQVSIAIAALTYLFIGLLYLKKLLQINGASDLSTAIVIILLFFGTNLLNYTLAEAAMSHVYSFSLISLFLYHSCRYVQSSRQSNLFWAASVLGLIILVRPNNIFIVLACLFWFRNLSECGSFLKNFFTSRRFFQAALITVTILSLQSIIWLIQSGRLFQYTYKADGFYWLRPQLTDMLFGFEAGLFIYTPLSLIFLFGIFTLYRNNKFSFFVAAGFLLCLFYFFSSYWAYTYFDGLGIRVLVDYYSFFGVLGAKLLDHLFVNRAAWTSIIVAAAVCACINVIYCYQYDRSIIMRSSMNFNKWKYVFLKTGNEYRNVLGGIEDLQPFTKQKPAAALSKKLDAPANFTEMEYGGGIIFDSIGFASNRVNFQIKCRRQELIENASQEVYICLMLQSKQQQGKDYLQVRLNETPAKSCCPAKSYEYSANMVADFKKDDRLLIYVWNRLRQPFILEQLSVEVFNYNYLIN